MPFGPEGIAEEDGIVWCPAPTLIALLHFIFSLNVAVSSHLAVNSTKSGPGSHYLVASTELVVLKMLLNE